MLIKDKRTVVLYDLFVQIEKPGDPVTSAHIDDLVSDLSIPAVRTSTTLRQAVSKYDSSERLVRVLDYEIGAAAHKLLFVSADPSAVDSSFVNRDDSTIRHAMRNANEDPGFSAHLIIGRSRRIENYVQRTVAAYPCALEDVPSLGITRISLLLNSLIANKYVVANVDGESKKLKIKMLFRPLAAESIVDAVKGGASILETYRIEQEPKKKKVDGVDKYRETTVERRQVRRGITDISTLMADFGEWVGPWLGGGDKGKRRTAYVKLNVDGHHKTIRYTDKDDVSDTERLFAKRYDVPFPGESLAQCSERIVPTVAVKMESLISGESDVLGVDSGPDAAEVSKDQG